MKRHLSGILLSAFIFPQQSLLASAPEKASPPKPASSAPTPQATPNAGSKDKAPAPATATATAAKAPEAAKVPEKKAVPMTQAEELKFLREENKALKTEIEGMKKRIEGFENKEKEAIVPHVQEKLWTLIEGSTNEEDILHTIEEAKGLIDRGLGTMTSFEDPKKGMSLLTAAMKHDVKHTLLPAFLALTKNKLALSQLPDFVQSYASHGEALDDEKIAIAHEIFDFKIVPTISPTIVVGDQVRRGPDWEKGGWGSQDGGNRIGRVVGFPSKWSRAGNTVPLDLGVVVTWSGDEKQFNYRWHEPANDVYPFRENTNLTELLDLANHKVNRILLSHPEVKKFSTRPAKDDLQMIYAQFGKSPESMLDLMDHFNSPGTADRAWNSMSLTAFQLALIFNEDQDMINAFIINRREPTENLQGILPRIPYNPWCGPGHDKAKVCSATGHTPLTFAVAFGKYKVAEALLEHFVKKDQPNAHGKVAKDYAKSSEMKDLLKRYPLKVEADDY